MVDKGLVCLSSRNTKCWGDHTKLWRGMRQGNLASLPPIFAGQVDRCLRRALDFNMKGQDTWSSITLPLAN